jgi:hypothetical protein
VDLSRSASEETVMKTLTTALTTVLTTALTTALTTVLTTVLTTALTTAFGGQIPSHLRHCESNARRRGDRDDDC